jgi:hypothetical protein
MSPVFPVCLVLFALLGIVEVGIVFGFVVGLVDAHFRQLGALTWRNYWLIILGRIFALFCFSFSSAIKISLVVAALST